MGIPTNLSKDPHETTSSYNEKVRRVFCGSIVVWAVEVWKFCRKFFFEVKTYSPFGKVSFFLEVKWSGNCWRHPNQATYRIAPIYGIIVYTPRFTIKINQKGKDAKNENMVPMSFGLFKRNSIVSWIIHSCWFKWLQVHEDREYVSLHGFMMTYVVLVASCYSSPFLTIGPMQSQAPSRGCLCKGFVRILMI